MDAMPTSAQSLCFPPTYACEPASSPTSIVANPELVDDPAYLSQYINDVRGPLCTDGRPANAEHMTLDDGARVGTLTTRRIEEDEEVLVDYGEAYWEARR